MRLITFSLSLCCAIILSGCSAIVNKQINNFSDNLARTIANFDDPTTVGNAIPTLLIVLESSAQGDQASGKLKLSAAQMYGAYSGAFVDEIERQKVLSTRAYRYAKEGSCKEAKSWCEVDKLNIEQFNQFVADLKANEINIAYVYATSLLSYIQAHSDNWSTVALLSRVQALLEFVLKTDESFDHAGAHLYLGAIATILPPALGGKAEIAQQHFERAIVLTEGKNLLLKVEYARRYARTVFDEELHHRLLTEVLDADYHVTDLTLMNAIAREQAKILLATESDYFD